MTSNWPKPASRVQKIRILFFTIFIFCLFGRCFFKGQSFKNLFVFTTGIANATSDCKMSPVLHYSVVYIFCSLLSLNPVWGFEKVYMKITNELTG